MLWQLWKKERTVTDRKQAPPSGADEPVMLLGVSRSGGHQRFSLREMLRSLFRSKQPPARSPRLPKPSRSVLASRTTAELSSGQDKK
jgi:hypothetical protein